MHAKTYLSIRYCINSKTKIPEINDDGWRLMTLVSYIKIVFSPMNEANVIIIIFYLYLEATIMNLLQKKTC